MPLNPTCAYCGREFPKPKRKRLCCDRICAAKLARVGQGIAPWSEDEIDYLRDRCESIPHQQIIDGFRRRGRKLGWPKRSRTAVEVKLKRLQRAENLQRKCLFDNWTMRELARCLEISHDRVRSWCRIGGLPYKKIARNQIAISKTALRQWLLGNPAKAADVELSRLEFVLDDPEAAAFIAGHEPDRRGYSRPVVCLDTGINFHSAKAADRAAYASPGCVSNACNTGGKAAGMRWAWVDAQKRVS